MSVLLYHGLWLPIKVAIELLSDMAESDADHIMPHLVQMLPVYTAALSDPASITIRLTAWRILGCLADHLSEPEQQKMFRSAIPTVLDMIQQLAKLGEYENAIKCVSVFDDLVECVCPFLPPVCPELTCHCRRFRCCPAT